MAIVINESVFSLASVNDCIAPGPVLTKGLSQGLGLKLRLLSQVSAQKLLRLLS